MIYYFFIQLLNYLLIYSSIYIFHSFIHLLNVIDINSFEYMDSLIHQYIYSFIMYVHLCIHL